jgi:hypothetical protein
MLISSSLLQLPGKFKLIIKQLAKTGKKQTAAKGGWRLFGEKKT